MLTSPSGALRPVPAALFGVGAVAGAVGAGLGAIGARDLLAARQRETTAIEEYEERLAAFEDLRNTVNKRLIDYSDLQHECFVGAVNRMIRWLRAHAKQVRESDKFLVDGFEASLTLVPAIAEHNPDIAGWLTGVSNTAVAGVGTAGAVTLAVERFGVAGTGAKISDLAGAAKQRAAAAFRGGGPIKDGGGGMALGKSATNAAVGGVSLLGAGATCKIQGTKALTHAEKVATDLEVACAELDEQDAMLKALVHRTDELTGILTGLHQRATVAMARLESLPFDQEQHMDALGEAVQLVKAVQMVAQASLLDQEGNLSDQSRTLAIRYRNMNEGDVHG